MHHSCVTCRFKCLSSLKQDGFWLAVYVHQMEQNLNVNYLVILYIYIYIYLKPSWTGPICEQWDDRRHILHILITCINVFNVLELCRGHVFMFNTAVFLHVQGACGYADTLFFTVFFYTMIPVFVMYHPRCYLLIKMWDKPTNITKH